MSQIVARRLVATAALLALFACTGPQTGVFKASGQAPVACTVTADGAPPLPLVAQRGLGGTGAKALADRGLGGTGAKAVADRGFGGTGAPPRLLAERGIGGTGSPATGVIGTITGFASVCVNGLEVTYDADASVEIDGVTQESTALRIGAVASIVTDPGLAAARISVRHAVSGPIETVLVPGRVFIVAGQRVELGGQTTKAAAFTRGDWLEVSGLRTHAQTIMASRVDLRPPGDVVITGRYEQANGRASIAGTPVAGILTPGMFGQVITVIGPYLNGVLYADAAMESVDLATDGTPGLLVVESYVQADGDHLLLSDGTEAAVTADIRSVPQSPTLVVLMLSHNASGGLTAIGLHDGTLAQGAAVSATATTATTSTTATPGVVAPHSTATTAVGTTTVAASAAAAHASTSATSKAGTSSVSTSKGTTSSSAGSKGTTSSGSGATSSGSSSTGGKGGATGGATGGSASGGSGSAKGSAAAGESGSSSGSTGGTGSSTKK